MAYAQPNDMMTKEGPEDKLRFAQSEGAYSWRYGPNVTVYAGPDMTPAEREEVSVLSSFATTEPYKAILGGLEENRYICMRPRWAYRACAQRYPDHLAPQYCAGPTFEMARCRMKLARKVQHICHKEIKSLAQCFRENGQGNRAKCFDQHLAFDMCTEDF